MRGVTTAWSADGPDGRRATGRALLAGLGAEDVTALRPSCGGAHGRVSTASGHASVAHADGVTVVAFSPDRPVGVDLERADARTPGATVRRRTRIEAVRKADGCRPGIAAERIRFTGDGRAVLDGVVYDLEPIPVDGFIATLARARAVPATTAVGPRILPHPRRPR
ncbi:hypothetical protein [Arenivirga flava]|uniref:Uncharacterized protein n=1 Tax=Arenivirga flava TaxID=1930060 RepID=A0AA37UT29_9MICO|nr:hypothetical protein [Arenivirga flava]GMA29736.1 hypothetical protein GCM10025874_29890 [Arenivirga flava]